MTDETKKEVKWIEQTGSNRWSPSKEGDSIMGELIEIDPNGTYGPEYTLKTVPDQEVVKLPSHKVLQNRMIKASLGILVKVTYECELDPKVRGENPTKIYKVEFAQ